MRFEKSFNIQKNYTKFSKPNQRAWENLAALVTNLDRLSGLAYLECIAKKKNEIVRNL